MSVFVIIVLLSVVFLANTQSVHKNVEHTGPNARKSPLQTGRYHVFYAAFVFRVFTFAFSAAV